MQLQECSWWEFHVKFYKKLPKCFPQWLSRFTFPPAMYVCSGFSAASPTFGVTSIFYLATLMGIFSGISMVVLLYFPLILWWDVLHLGAHGSMAQGWLGPSLVVDWLSAGVMRTVEPHGLLSPFIQQPSLVTGQGSERVDVHKAFWDLVLELAHFYFPCILLLKASHKASPDSRSGDIDCLLLEGRNCKVKYPRV